MYAQLSDSVSKEEHFAVRSLVRTKYEEGHGVSEECRSMHAQVSESVSKEDRFVVRLLVRYRHEEGFRKRLEGGTLRCLVAGPLWV